MAGWLKLHRKIKDSNMYKSLNSKQRDVMFACLLSVNFTENEWEFEGKIYKCNSGQFVTSLDSLKQICSNDVKVQSVRTALLKLEKWGFLTNKSTKTGRLITICKWDTYQGENDEVNKDTNKEPTKSQQRSNKDLTSIEEGKESKEGKERKEIIDFLNLKSGKSFKYTTNKTIDCIKARYNEGFTIDDFKKVIDIKCKQWLNNENEKYLRPETLFGTKFEGYLNESPRAKPKHEKPNYNDGKIRFKVRYIGDPKEYIHTEDEINKKVSDNYPIRCKQEMN